MTGCKSLLRGALVLGLLAVAGASARLDQVLQAHIVEAPKQPAPYSQYARTRPVQALSDSMTVESGAHHSVQQKQQSLTNGKDEETFQQSDPLHDPDYREAFLHVDGSITEKVLMMLQEHSPVSSGALSPVVGWIIFLIICTGMLYLWMVAQKCNDPRSNTTVDRLREMRALRAMAKLEEQA